MNNSDNNNGAAARPRATGGADVTRQRRRARTWNVWVYINESGNPCYVYDTHPQTSAWAAGWDEAGQRVVPVRVTEILKPRKWLKAKTR